MYRGDKGAESKAAIAGNDYRFNRIHKHGDDESSRGLSPEAIARITETLGAINTVGRYLVNYTKGGASPTDLFTHEDQQASPVRTKTFNMFVAFATTVRPWYNIRTTFFLCLCLHTAETQRRSAQGDIHDQ